VGAVAEGSDGWSGRGETGAPAGVIRELQPQFVA